MFVMESVFVKDIQREFYLGFNIKVLLNLKLITVLCLCVPQGAGAAGYG